MNATIIRETCGTSRGYRQHSKRGEERCQPCKTAWSARCKQYSPQSGMSADELTHEIEWMLTLNQGQHYILKAIGYVGREASLETRLQRHGRQDLVRRLLMMDRVGA